MTGRKRLRFARSADSDRGANAACSSLFKNWRGGTRTKDQQVQKKYTTGLFTLWGSRWCAGDKVTEGSARGELHSLKSPTKALSRKPILLCSC